MRSNPPEDGHPQNLTRMIFRTLDNAGVNKVPRIVAAVSGGGDSMAMGLLLAPYARTHGIDYILAYFDHATDLVRNRNEWARVKDLARRLNHVARRGSAEAYGSLTGYGKEDLWRNQRYAFLKEVAGESGIVATAHTLDDQAESFLLAAIRGGHGSGLAGIRGFRDDRIVRPVLSCRREALRAVLKNAGIQWIEDPMNEDIRHPRSLLRHKIVPALVEGFGQSAVRGLARSAHLMFHWERSIQRSAEKALGEISRGSEGQSLTLDLRRFGEYHDAVRARIIRLALEQMSGGQRIPLIIHSDRLNAFITGNGQRLGLPLGFEARKIGRNTLRISAPIDQVRPIFEYPLSVPGLTPIPELGSMIRTSVIWVGNVSQDLPRCGPSTALVDRKGLCEPLIVRNRKIGDRIVPLGFQAGRIRVKKYLRDRGIPLERRWSYPAIVGKHTGTIVWIPEVVRCRVAAIDTDTDQVLCLQYLY